ncbi:MAG: cupin domain-containing protein [Pseudomonadota bacterium]
MVQLNRVNESKSVTAPDGLTVRPRGRVGGCSVATFELDTGHTGRAIVHPRLEEIWLVLEGEIEIWSRAEDGQESVDQARPGDCICIPARTAFQVRNVGAIRLRVAAATSPSWESDADVELVKGHWEAELGSESV